MQLYRKIFPSHTRIIPCGKVLGKKDCAQKGKRIAKIVVGDPCFGKCSNAIETLRRRRHRVVVCPFPVTEDEICSAIRNAEALIAGPYRISAHTIQSAVKLRIIARYGVGVDNIDLEVATAQRVIVTNAVGANRHAVADYVFCLMLALARRVCYADRHLKQGEWQVIQGTDIWQKTLGVLGAGNIGRRVIQTAQGFDMNILVHDIRQDLSLIDQFQVKYVSLKELLENSDFVTIHLPRTPKTTGLIGAEEFRLMKPSSYLINTARGSIVDEQALFNALKKKQIAGAALDVFTDEPLTTSGLFTLNNMITTPHIASNTEGAMQQVDSICLDNVLRVLEGKNPLTPVNFPFSPTGEDRQAI